MDTSNRLLIRLGKIEEAEAPADPLFHSMNLSRFYFPGRGIIPSLLAHIAAGLVLFFFPLIRSSLLPTPPPEKVVFIDLRAPMTAMYLPPLEGNKQQAKAARPAESSSAAAAPAEGLSYPGLQPILSDVPDPTNSIQTILKPKVENPRTLVPPLPIPNMVQTEKTPMVVQAPQEPATEPEMVMPELESTAPDRIRTEDLTHPMESPSTEVSEPPMNFPEMEVPDLVRTDAEPELALPESQSAPIERMQTSGPKIPNNPPGAETPKPADIFPKVEIPDLVRTDAEPEMVLPEPQSAPIERMQTSGPKIPNNPPGAETPKPLNIFPKVEIPDLVRTEAEPELALPEPQSAPIERMQTSGRKIPNNPPDAEYSNPQRKAAEARMPDLMKVPAPPPAEKAATKTASSETATGTPAPIPQAKQPPSPAQGEPFISLTPMPALPATQIVIPEGEARGRFAISPEPNLEAQGQEPGAKPKNTQAESPSESEAPKSAVPQSGNSTASDIPGAGTTDSGKEAPDFVVNQSAGTGDDAFGGITITGGAGQTPDNAGIAIVTPGQNPDDEFEILGGGFEAGSLPDQVPVKRKPRPLQNSYSLSIVSTENSGGGLPYYGVFQEDLIYTVYLDVRESEYEEDPSWILEFGLAENTGDSPIVSLDLETYKEGLLVPFPLVKKRPNFPEDLIRKYQGGMMVVNGIITAEGIIDQISIKDSPDPVLSEELLKVLDTWKFRPARLDGKPVAVKVLMGIPLWLPDGTLDSPQP